MSESVSSAQSTVEADEAKLAEDEANQSSAASSSSSSASSSSGRQHVLVGVAAEGSTGPGHASATTTTAHVAGARQRQCEARDGPIRSSPRTRPR